LLVGVARTRHGLQVRVQVRPRDRGARVGAAGFGWRVLHSLVDEVNVKLADDGEEQLGIHLVKRQPAHTRDEQTDEQ